MAVELVTSWYTLFAYAHAVGQARLKYNKTKSAEDLAALYEAMHIHEDYRQMCLKADRMIHCPDVSWPRG